MIIFLIFMELPLPMLKGITVFGAANCSFCVKAKNVLTTLNMEFTYVDLDLCGDRKELCAKLRTAGVIPVHAKTIPLVFVDGKFIGGYTELNMHLDSLALLNDDF